MISSSSAHMLDDLAGLSHKSFARLAGYITDELGIKVPTSKATMLQSRLLRRVRELGMSSIDQYSDYLLCEGRKAERDNFINAITTNKTDFFREPEHFSFLAQRVIPDFITRQKKCTSQFNVWSAACSSGEEPYTLAITLAECARFTERLNFAVLATDISTKVLEHARRAIYADERLSPVPADLRRRYFLQNRERENRTVRVAPELRAKVSIHRLNLMGEDYRIKNRFDAIFLRNVLIYFERDVQETVVARICKYLNPGGFLFVGHSESLADLQINLARVHTSVYRMPN